MAEILLSQPTAAEVAGERQREAAAAQAAAHVSILRVQTAATIMGGLMQVSYRDALDKAQEEWQAAKREIAKAKNHGQRINGTPQPPQVRIDFGTPAAIATAAADALLQTLGILAAPEQQSEEAKVALCQP